MWIYIILRLFVPKKNYTLEGDEIRHLATARNFYKLWNRSFYDAHPPFYSWLVKVFYSGVLVSFLCSIGLYFVSSALLKVLGATPFQQGIALCFLTFNYTLIYYSNRTFRYQLIVLLGTSMVYFLLSHRFLEAGLIWGLLGLTCTFAGLRGFFIWALLGFNPTTLIVFMVIFSSWLIDKAWVYTKNEYYPSGIEGMVEKVKPFTFRQLFSPLYFPWVYSYYSKGELGYSFKDWFKKVGGVFGLYPPLTFLVPVALFFVIKGALKSPLWISGIVGCLLYPSVYKRFLPRNAIIAIPLVGFLLAKGFPEVPLGWLWLSVGALVAGFLYKNRVLCFTKPKIKVKITSRVLNNLVLDGLLVDGYICQPIAYQTKKRILVLSRDPIMDRAIYQTDLVIEKFGINYIVLSEKHIDYPAASYITNCFDYFKTVKEDGDTYYIYEIPKEER